MDDSEYIVNKKILYELLIYTEWKLEPEIWKQSTSSLERWSNAFSLIYRHLLTFYKQAESPVDEIARVLSTHLPWQFAYGEEGKVVAILQETVLEVRTSRDDYTSIIGKAAVPRDASPQLRRLAWSPDCSMLAIATSTGALCLYDLLGSNLFNIPSTKARRDGCSTDFEDAPSGLLFLKPRNKSEKWSGELLMVDFSGQLSCYLVSPTEGYEESHHFKFPYHFYGVASIAWHPAHHTLFVASPNKSRHLSFEDIGYGWGLSAWRILNDYPFYHCAIPSSDQQASSNATWNLFSGLPDFKRMHQPSTVFKMQISPEGKFLACLHTCATISIWHLPSLKLFKMWTLQQQPHFDVQNPSEKKRPNKTSLEDYHAVDINWWEEEKLIIVRRNGGVTISEINGLRNLLGELPEFLCGEPRLSAFCSPNGVFTLEAQVTFVRNKRYNHDQQEESSSSEENEGNSFMNGSSALVHSTFYLVTDMERFQPKKKRPKIVQRTYRLVYLKRTTPEELFTRKIDSGDYSEALSLAQAYHLDSDRVYQRQWHSNPVSVATICNYLSKIRKRSWVLAECCERVPETLSAAKELLQFGLRATDISVFVPHCRLSAEFDKDVTEERKKESHQKREETMRSKVISNELTDSEKDLIVTRHKLLSYSDRLHTYELILGGSLVAEDQFDRSDYDSFRQEPLLDSAIMFARQGNAKAIEYLLTFHGEETLPYWLMILENFPETISPVEYKILLPECTSEGTVFLWNQSRIREEDWSEASHFQGLLKRSQVPPKPSDVLSPKQLTEWYRNRAYELEQCSCIPDMALGLVNLARERNIQGLDSLYFELLTLDTLVYEVGVEEISLSELEKKSPFEKIHLLMGKTSLETFIDDVQHRLAPYLNRCEKLTPGSCCQLFAQYMIHISRDDLTLSLRLFEHLRDEPTNVVLPSLVDNLTLALDCLYAYTGIELDKAFSILECLPEIHSSDGDSMQARITEAECELVAASILCQHDLTKSLAYIHEHKTQPDTVKALMLRLARATANRLPPAYEHDWKKLLDDMLSLQKTVFTCLSLSLCIELFISTVLASGNQNIIRMAVAHLCCRRGDSGKQLSFELSVKLVLQAAREYFDSAISLSDPHMELAKSCLHLITDEVSSIQEELDLIAALQVLNEFGLTLLPMQVRLCSDRMRLVESCLSSKPNAYQHTQRLLAVAAKLHVCGNNARLRDSNVLVRIAQTAFEAGNYVFCAHICQRLIAEEQPLGWEVCQSLGQCLHYEDYVIKQKLTAFAMLHCPTENLQQLIETRSQVEEELLRVDVTNHMEDLEGQDEDFVDALTSPETPTKEFLPTLTGKMYFLAQITKPNFWKNAFNLMSNASDSTTISKNKGMLRQAMPSFYASLFGTCHESILWSCYDSWEMNQCCDVERFHLSQNLLRFTLLDSEPYTTDMLKHVHSVLLHCAEQLMREDTALGLAHLLSVSNPVDTEQCFVSLPQTTFTYQLACYFYALLHALQQDKDAIYASPQQLVSRVLVSSELSPCAELVVKYQSKLLELQQAERIESLECGVNMNRFSTDTEYKHDSILGLAMCSEWNKLELAFELGQRHNMPASEIAVTHIISLLLTDNSQLLSERLADKRLVMILKEVPSIVVERLCGTVWPSVSGINYQQLLAYFSVLQLVAENETCHNLLPREHIKLIKRVKATSTAIEYKELVTKKKPLLEILRPALSEATVASVAKLLKSLPPSLRSALTVPKLFCDWALMLFNNHCLDCGEMEEALAEFESLQCYIPKMGAEQVVRFTREALFTEKTVSSLDPTTRKKMIDIILQTSSKATKEWMEASNKIYQLRQHLSSVWWSGLDTSTCKPLKLILEELDLSCGDTKSIEDVLQGAVLNKAISNSTLQTLIKNHLHHKSLPPFLSHALNVLEEEACLCTVLKRIGECLDVGIQELCWKEELSKLAKQTNHTSQLRFQVISLMQRLEEGESEREHWLIMSEALITSTWDDGTLVTGIWELSDEMARATLFTNLLTASQSWDQLIALARLLELWPPFELPQTLTDECPQLRLAEKMLLFPTKLTVPALTEIFAQNNFGEHNMMHLMSKVEATCSSMSIVCLCLLSGWPSLHKKAIDIFHKLQPMECVPVEVLEIIISKGLVSEVVATPVYAQLIALCNGGHVPDTYSAIHSQLLGAKLYPEAGSLAMANASVPLSLRTFSAALATNFSLL